MWWQLIIDTPGIGLRYQSFIKINMESFYNFFLFKSIHDYFEVLMS